LAIFFSTPGLRVDRTLDFLAGCFFAFFAADLTAGFLLTVAFTVLFAALLAALFFGLFLAAGFRVVDFAAFAVPVVFLAGAFFADTLLPELVFFIALDLVVFLAAVLFFAAVPFFAVETFFFAVPFLPAIVAGLRFFAVLVPLFLVPVVPFFAAAALVFPVPEDFFEAAALVPEVLRELPRLLLVPEEVLFFGIALSLLNRFHSISVFLLIW
jgi:hypothetical protein